MKKLNNWARKYFARDGYVPPELAPTAIEGTTDEGEQVIIPSNTIIHFEGRIITVRTSERMVPRYEDQYELGEVDPGYREWLRQNRPNWDENNPIV